MGAISADPGIGDESAPIGSEEWAQHVRLHSQQLVKSALRYPESVQRYVDLIVRHRAWEKLNRRDGSKFTSWEEFCETEQPYGWGVPWEKLQGVIANALAKSSPGHSVEKIVALGTVAPATPINERSPGRPSKAEEEIRDRLSPVSIADGAGEKEAKRFRAINRAPEPIRAAFTGDLISKASAVKLGAVAFDTSPDLAATRAELVAKVSEVIAAKAPKTKPEKRAVAREVNALVKTALAAPAPDPIPPILRQLARLDASQLERVVDEAQRLLIAKGPHAQT